MALTPLLLASFVLLAAAALHDAAFRTVPNRIALALAVVGIATRGAAGDLAPAAAAALLVFGAGTFCWSRGWMGGADVKLLGAAALLVPPHQVPMMITAIALSGGLLALPYLAARRRLAAPIAARPGLLAARILRAERWRLRRGGPLPYAVAIATGAAFTQGVAS